MRIAAYVVLVMLVAGGFEPYYVRIFAADGDAMRTAMTELPYRKLPGFRRLLLDADRSIPRGARVAIALPFTQWDGGYGYGYDRASFLLPGRQLVPLLEVDRDVPKPSNLRYADYVVAWPSAPRLDGFVPLSITRDGALLVRRR